MELVEADGAPFSNTIEVGGQLIRYQEVSGPDEDVLLIEVNDTHNSDEVKGGIRRAVAEHYWFLRPEHQGTTVTQKVGIVLAEGVEVEVFSFREDMLAKEELEAIGGTLSTMYHSLKDKRQWSLASIQIRKEDELNRKSGEPYRGKEWPQEQRFELFPASFEEGQYRGVVETTWLEGSVAHETTHIVLDPHLRPLWEVNRKELGWTTRDGVRVRLPGGSVVTEFNVRWSECPTEYASYQADDDRADSVACFLLDPSRLSETRYQLVNTILERPEGETHFGLRHYEPELPTLSEVKVQIQTIQPSGFFIHGRRESGEPAQITDLEELRSQLA